MTLRTLRFGGAIALLALGMAGGSMLAAQPDGAPQPGRQGPPPEMIEACKAKSQGNACSSTMRDGRRVEGTCEAPQGRPLACRPKGHRPGMRPAGGPPPDNGGGNSGEPLADSEADTSGVLCTLSSNGTNAGLGLDGMAQWSCLDGRRTLSANAIPLHPVGNFPNAHNPNAISAQQVNFGAPARPVVLSGVGGMMRVPGYALNGIKFEPSTNGRCESSMSSPSQCDLGFGRGDWSIEALGGSTFDFGVDASNAHVQPNGEYHYHGIPTGLLRDNAIKGQAMQLIGWAADGFPIYARLGHSDARLAGSPLRAMRPSYRIKQSPDSGRPSTALVPMGAFTQDYEYVAGLGDLDQCNGRFGVTPEFPKGIYHYYATDSFPFVQRCVKGRV